MMVYLTYEKSLIGIHQCEVSLASAWYAVVDQRSGIHTSANLGPAMPLKNVIVEVEDMPIFSVFEVNCLS